MLPSSILESIMTAEEYSQLEHPTPYVFELKSHDKYLCYFGTRHERNPHSELFDEINTLFTRVNPDAVFIEGISGQEVGAGFDAKVRTSFRRDIIDRMGEPGYTARLAIKKGIPWYCPEPSDEDLYRDLLDRGFSKREIFTWDVFQMLPQYNRQVQRLGFKKYVSRNIERFIRATNWTDFDYSYESAIVYGEQILGRSVDVEREPDALSFIDPITWDHTTNTETVLNRISKQSSIFRDRTIVTHITQAFEKHSRIFVVYGASHAVMQEPALKKFFETTYIHA